VLYSLLRQSEQLPILYSTTLQQSLSLLTFLCTQWLRCTTGQRRGPIHGLRYAGGLITAGLLKPVARTSTALPYATTMNRSVCGLTWISALFIHEISHSQQTCLHYMEPWVTTDKPSIRCNNLTRRAGGRADGRTSCVHRMTAYGMYSSHSTHCAPHGNSPNYCRCHCSLTQSLERLSTFK
jgi:hypothetical protein